MLDWLIKDLVKTLVNTLWDAAVAIVGWAFKLPLWLTENRSDRSIRLQKERQRKLMATLTYDNVRNIVRKDGKERVRIVRDGENFGAVVEGYDPRTQGWSPLQAVGAGCNYDSIEAAEAEAVSVAPWLKSQERNAGAAPPTTPGTVRPAADAGRAPSSSASDR